jgi:hypothetical protein
MKDIQKIKEFFSKPMKESLTGGYPHTKSSGENFEKITITEPIDDATKNKMIKNFRAAGWDAKPNNGGGITAIKKAMMEAKKETAVDMAKKQLDALGVKYELGNEFKPFKVIYKPTGQSDEFYDTFEDIVDLFSLKGVVKSSMNEAKISHFKIGDVVELKTIPENLPYEIRKGIIDNKWEIIRVSKSGRSMHSDIMEDVFGYDIELLDKKLKYKMFVYPEDVKQSMSEAKEEDKVDTITMDVPLFIRMLEYSREDAAEDMDLHDVTEKAISLGKERGILQMDDYDEIIGTTEKVNEVNLKQAKLSSAEYQKAKKLKDFKASDWKWNADEDLYTKVNEGIEKRIDEVLDKINEELCPAGKAYIKRRQAAGEKSSAYLSGRGVKVCKGQMSGKAKKK